MAKKTAKNNKTTNGESNSSNNNKESQKNPKSPPAAAKGKSHKRKSEGNGMVNGGARANRGSSASRDSENNHAQGVFTSPTKSLRGPPPLLSPGGRQVKAPQVPWLGNDSAADGWNLEGFNPNGSFSDFDAPSATAGYDDRSRNDQSHVGHHQVKKDIDDQTTKSEEERLSKTLKERGINQEIEVENHEHNRVSEISLGNESYILDLAQQKETREKDLKEEVLEEAAALYKTALREGAVASDELFLMIVTEVKKEFEQKYKDHYRRQDERLDQALNDELKKREQEGTIDQEIEDESYLEESPYSMKKSVRVSAFIKKERSKRKNDAGRNEDNESEPVPMSEGTMITVDLEEKQKDKPKKEDPKETTKCLVPFLFGPKKKDVAEEKKKEENLHVPNSEVFRELQKKQNTAPPQVKSKSNAAKGRDLQKKQNTTPQVRNKSNAGKARSESPVDIETGQKGEEVEAVQPRRACYSKLTRIFVIGVSIFLVLDVVMLVVFLLKRKN